MPSQAEGWRYTEGAFEDEPPLALIGIEAAIVLGIPLAWGLAWADIAPEPSRLV